ncbi:MAG: Imm30 family immunity protein [Cetobacterium sp.]
MKSAQEKRLEELYRDLEKYQNFDVGDNTEKFLDTADQIVLRLDPSSIEVLLKYFDDENEYDWVFTSLIRVIEYYPAEVHSRELVRCIQMLLKKAPVFCDEIFNRIFNSSPDLSLFRTNMHLAPKASLLKLFSIMEEKSPHHHELIQELRKELEKS